MMIKWTHWHSSIFTCQNFPSPNSSKFSTVKTLCHMHLNVVLQALPMMLLASVLYVVMVIKALMINAVSVLACLTTPMIPPYTCSYILYDASSNLVNAFIIVNRSHCYVHKYGYVTTCMCMHVYRYIISKILINVSVRNFIL